MNGCYTFKKGIQIKKGLVKEFGNVFKGITKAVLKTKQKLKKNKQTKNTGFPLQ